MRNYKQYQGKQKGFTLMELLLGLVIVGVIITVGILVYAQTSSSANAYKSGNQVINIATSVKSLYTTPNYTSLATSGSTGEQLIINSGKAPQDMINGTGATATLSGLWGGQVTVWSATYNGTANSAFQITYPNVPKNECNGMLAAVNPNFQQITVGSGVGAGTTVKDDSAAPAVKYDAATTVTACNNTSNTITLTST